MCVREKVCVCVGGGVPCYFKNPLHTDRWRLLKHIYRVDRAAIHQSTTDMENYENMSLNKPVTVMMNQHT